MKKGIQILILIFTCYQVNSQTLSWTKSTGKASAIAVDNFGSVITVGNFSGTIDLDPGITTNNVTAIGPYDMFIQKLDSNGNFLWGYAFGTSANGSYDIFNDVAVDNNNNIYAVGTFGGLVDFDPSSGVSVLDNGSSTAIGGVIVKFNANGVFQFCYGLNNFGGSSTFGGLSIKGNNLYLTGTFTWIQDFNFNSSNVFNMSSNSWQVNSYTFNTFISKMDLNCNLVWAKQLRTKGYSYSGKITTDNYNNVITVGSFEDSIDLNPSPSNFFAFSNSYSNDSYVLKLDSLGNFIWAKTFGGPGTERSSGICVDNNDNYYISGTYQNTVDFDPNLGQFNMTATGAGGESQYLLKLNSLGQFNWCLSSNSANTYGRVRYHNNMIYAGVFNNAFDINGIQQYPSNFFPLTSDFYANNNNIYLCGYNNSIVNKYSQCITNYNTISVTNCNNVTVNGVTYSSSGTYTQTLVNSVGCDSILTIIATVKQPTSNTISVTNCYNVTVNGVTYSSSGTYTQTLINSVGCDSILTINATVNQPTSNSISVTNCNSVNVNGIIYTLSGTYTQTLLNSVGCDSILTINATVKQPTSNSISVMNCDSVNVNGVIYTSSGTYTQTLTNSVGCDSILTINAIVNQATSNSISVTNCNNVTVNGVTYTTSGTYTQTLTNSVGCDSILTIIANITILDTTITLTGNILSSNATSATYQWLTCNPFTIISGATNQHYTAISNSDYAVIINQNGCIDTSNCIKLTNLSIYENTLNQNLFSIFPNPIYNEFTIKNEQNLDIKHIELLNILGAKIKELSSDNPTKNTFDISNLLPNIYIIKISTSEGVFFKKIQKQ